MSQVHGESEKQRNAAVGRADTPALRSMLSTAELLRRPSRPPDYKAEIDAILTLAQAMAASPESILQKLADTTLTLCQAHSAGLSLLEDGDQKGNFHWRAIAGQWAPHLDGGTPRNFGPCGTVLDRNTAMVCSHPELDFPYWRPIKPFLEEGLLVPFYIKGEAVGTIWAIAHDTSRRFDAEDLRLLTSLGTFASAAYQTWLSMNATITQITALAREAEHRARNVLATVQATVHLSHSDTPENLKHTIEGRIQALANVHRLFVESRWTGAELHNLAKEELAAYCEDGDGRVGIDGPKVVMRPDIAQAVAVTLHELTTNAAKYGALSVAEGRVRVEWSHASEGGLVLHWTEQGGPPVKPPTRHGFGTHVISDLIQRQLKGEMRFNWRPEGLACELVVK